MDPKIIALAGKEFIDKLKEAAKNIKQINSSIDENNVECKHCKRIIFAGPPCCYQYLLDRNKEFESQIYWYRKIVSKKDKKINELKAEIYDLNILLRK